MTTAPFPVDPVLVGITLAYRNPRYIADEVLPRVPVGREEFKYWKYPEDEAFRVPDTKVGRRSRPNEIVLTATESTASTEDYGLEDAVPNDDIRNAPANHSPVDRATVQLTEYILIDREQRVANLVFNSSSYASANVTTLSGTSQWSDQANSDPVDAITAALDVPLVRPNIMVLGRAVWTKLRTHPKVVAAVKPAGAREASGVAMRQAVAELFELEEVLVGEAWINTAKKGQAASISRVWGKHCALLFRDRTADTRSGLTFGFTAQFGSRIAGTRPDPDIGLRGGVRVRVGESLKELVIANQAGYLFQNAVA